MRMFREESTARSRREYSGEVVTRQSMDRAAVEEQGYSNGSQEARGVPERHFLNSMVRGSGCERNSLHIATCI